MKEPDMSTAVLVNVDDYDPARYARTRVLRQAGFIVHDAATGGDALRLIDELDPDLVLLDVHLPDINGIEVCRRIKSQNSSSSVIVVQISASAISAPQATTALNTGADSYLIEPVDPDVLVAAVRALLRLRAAERALAKVNQELSAKNEQLQAVNEELRRSNDDLEHFAYVASHDLQEPLRNITTYLELLDRLTKTRFNQTERQLFSVVTTSALRMSALIRDVLSYAGISRGAARAAPTNLNDSLAVALENLAERIATSGALLDAGPLPTVMGDTMQLSWVFQNLIANSIKYRSPDKPLYIKIRAEPDGPGAWRILVGDNGIGIASEYHRRVFQPFKRLHGPEIPGNGIGLAYCLRIIESHSGRIWVESEEGRGATFYFTLNAAVPAKTRPAVARGA
jgi:two-component system sensor histidine kinase/response regulator